MEVYKIASRSKFTKEIKRALKKIDGCEFVDLEHKSHGGHQVLHFTYNGHPFKTVCSYTKEVTGTIKAIVKNVKKAAGIQK